MARGWLIGGGAFLVVLLVAAIVVALTQQEAELAEGSPEAAVQSYLRAIDAEDYQTAYGLLSQDIKNDCEFQDFVSSISQYERNTLGDSDIILEDASVVDDTAVVTMRISQFERGDLFGSSQYSYNQTYTLKMEGGEWRLTQNPWPFFYCDTFRTPAPPAPIPVVPITPTPTPEPTVTPSA
ncbi:MAG: hypothetical protein L0177_04350 [Chloroflexi bacterium]|nr:hypothetical protein [Chloroflexota bacterium]